MTNKGRKRLVFVMVVALVLWAGQGRTVAVALTMDCFGEYEQALNELRDKTWNCMVNAYETSSWYRPDLLSHQIGLCNMEHISGAMEALAKYVGCMGVNVFKVT